MIEELEPKNENEQEVQKEDQSSEEDSKLEQNDKPAEDTPLAQEDEYWLEGATAEQIEEYKLKKLEEEKELSAEEQEKLDKEKNRKLNKKFLILILGFMVCSLLYLVCASIGKYNMLYHVDFDTTKDSISSITALKYIKYAMYVCYAISIVGFIFLILHFTKVKINIPLARKEQIYDILDWVIILPICIVITTICFSLIFTFTVVNGESMQPTLYQNDKLFVLYHKKIEHNDVVIVYADKEKYFNVEKNSLYVKRVIALPGDKIQNEYGDLIINGEKADMSFCKKNAYDRVENNFNSTIAKGVKELSRDTAFNFCFVADVVNDKKQICEYTDDLIFTVPKGYYLVLGDNRGNSKDSRRLGLISKDDIEGVVVSKIEGIIGFKKIN